MENLDVVFNLITLTGLEIVLGIDNVIFIALLVEHLPKKERQKVRIFGLSLALALRVLMLLGISWIIKLKEPLFSLFNFDFSGRNILLIVGGLFLVVKGFMELKYMFEDEPKGPENNKKSNSYFKVISQIIFIDLVLSFDSVITAVAMSPDNIAVIITAISIAMVVMLISSASIGDFINKNPSIKVIALNFILLVGVMLVVNGFDFYFSKGYLYFAMFFTLITELINIRLNKKKEHKKKE